MLFDPLAHYAVSLRKEELQHNELYEFEKSPVYSFAVAGNAQPFAAAIAFHELAKIFNWDAVKYTLLRLFGYTRHEASAHDRSWYEDQLGISLPVSDREFAEMLAEVKKYKWLEAERAGRDIWKEKNPSNPEVGALREWFRLHFGAWYLSRKA